MSPIGFPLCGVGFPTLRESVTFLGQTEVFLHGPDYGGGHGHYEKCPTSRACGGAGVCIMMDVIIVALRNR